MTTLTLYQDLLPAVEVDVAGQTMDFLFDTGAGITVITPAVARLLGLTPSGRGTGFRKSGERIDAPRCDGVPLSLSNGIDLSANCLVLDLMELLPPGWPPLGGAIALNAFEGRAVRMSGGRTLEMGPRQRLADELDGVDGEARHVRQVGGLSLCVSVAVGGPGITLWFVLDSGNTGPTLIAPHAAALLGIERSHRPTEATIPLMGVGDVRTQVRVQDMIYDGLIGYPTMSQLDLVLDLDQPGLAIKL